MGVSKVGTRPPKKEKKSGVLSGKIEKTKDKLNNKPVKGIDEVKNKSDKKAFKKLSKVTKKENGTPSPLPSKKIKKEMLQKVTTSPSDSSNQGVSINPSKLEKKDKFNKVKKIKNPEKSSEAVTNVGSVKSRRSKRGGKKRRKSEAKDVSEGASPTQKKEKVKKEKKITTLTKEQEEKIQSRRAEKFKIWEENIDFILQQKSLPKDQAALLKKSKNYTKLPLWKKPFLAWVKTDPNYAHRSQMDLIRKVYKVLKKAERKVKRTKYNASKALPPRTLKTQAAIERCVEMASGGADTPVVDQVVKKEMGEESSFTPLKQKRGGKVKSDFKQKKESRKSIENSVTKKSKAIKMEQ